MNEESNIGREEVAEALDPDIGDGTPETAPAILPGNPSILEERPVLVAITGLVAAAIALLVAFGVEITAAQTAAIVGFVGAAYAVAILFVEKRTTPVANPKLTDDVRLTPDV